MYSKVGRASGNTEVTHNVCSQQMIYIPNVALVQFGKQYLLIYNHTDTIFHSEKVLCQTFIK